MVETSIQLEELFFRELKQYNSTNFNHICKANLENIDITSIKAFSSVITRFFIFRDKHPEIDDQLVRMLYFKLKLDLVAHYFANYPKSDIDNLVGFHREILMYVESVRRNNE